MHLAHLGLGFAAILTSCSTTSVTADLVLRGGQLLDGSGGEARRADIALIGDRIVAIGDLVAADGAAVIDCRGLTIAPGFIDLHNHSDRSVLQSRNQPCTNYLTQGCTTMVTGNCGSGRLDIAKFLDEVDAAALGANIVHLVPHGELRRAVMDDAARHACAAEMADMATKLEAGLRAGAWGMSTGLYYVPGVFADTRELVHLGKVLARHDALYATHMRHEDVRIMDSIDELLRIGRDGGCAVHLSHFKARGKDAWGLVKEVADRIELARSAGVRVTADQYPYTAASSSLQAYLVPGWARQGGAGAMRRRLDDPDDGPRIRAAMSSNLERYDRIHLASFAEEPGWVGRSLAELAESQRHDPIDVALEVLRRGGASVVNHAMSEDDVRLVMALPWVAVASDGSVQVPGHNRPHPRSYGTFARRLGPYVRNGTTRLPAAIRSATGLPADILGLKDRGYLRVGFRADIVVFDADRIADRATFDAPFEHAVGIRHVFVNGAAAVRDGQPTGARAGRALRKPPFRTTK